MVMEAVLAPAKINLSLKILGKRDDGYHLLESHVIFVEYGDELLVQECEQLELDIAGEFAKQLDGEPLSGNLVYKSASALQRHCGVGHGAKITLVKKLPVGSGIGGGSADAAAALLALSRLWKIKISAAELAEIAITLGSDVPVCLYGKSAIIRGVGENITPAALPRQGYIVLINPLVPLSTAEVFREFANSTSTEKYSVRDNMLEVAAIRKLPVIAELIGQIARTHGNKLAAMSGSGATCFGLYDDENDAINAAHDLKEIYPEMWCISSRIKTE